MEEYMLETNVDPKIILGKAQTQTQTQMTTLAFSSQRESTLRSIEWWGVGGGIFQGQPPNVRNFPEVA